MSNINIPAIPKYARPNIANDLLKSFEKDIGNDQEATVTAWIDTGFAELNHIISGRYDGGLPQGRICEMYGPSMTGKTALATDWMKQSQVMGGVAGFVDWERTLNQEVAQKGFGLDLTAPYWVYKKPRTWEEGNDQMVEYAAWIRRNDVIHPEAPILLVGDSIASAVPQSVMYNAKVKETAGEEARQRLMSDYNMRDQLSLALATSQTFRKMAVYAEDYNATFLYLNQIRKDPTVMFGDPTKTPGGAAAEFYCTVRIALGRTMVKDAAKEIQGQDIGLKCVKSKLTAPYRETKLRLSFDADGISKFDKEFSLVDLLLERKKIPSPRAGYVEWDGKQRSKNEMAELVRTAGLTSQLNALLAS